MADGEPYKVIKIHVPGIQGPGGPGLAIGNTYDPGAGYDSNVVVFANGGGYASKRYVPAVDDGGTAPAIDDDGKPIETDDWLPVAAPGSNGADGIDGADGADGSDGTNGQDGAAGLNGRDGTNTNPRGAYSAGSTYVAKDDVDFAGQKYYLPVGAANQTGNAPPAAPWLADTATAAAIRAQTALAAIQSSANAIDGLFNYQRIGVPGAPVDGTAANHTNYHLHNTAISEPGLFKGFGYFAKTLSTVTIGLLSFAHEPPQLNDAAVVHDTATYTPTQLGLQVVTAGMMSKVMTGIVGYHWGIDGNGAFTTSVDTDGSDPGYFLVGVSGVGNLTNGSKLEVYFETKDSVPALTAATVAPLQDAAVANSNTINRNKNLPLKQARRNNVTSAASTVFNKFLLRCRIYGAPAGKEYMLTYVNNSSLPNSTCAGAMTDGSAYPVGTTVITLSAAGTGAVLAGSRVKFGGDTNTYIPSVGDADVSNGGTITLPAPGLRLAMGAGQHTITPVIAYAFGVTINEYDAGAMATTDNAVPIHTYTDVAPVLDITLTEQTVVIIPALRTGMRFELTVDPSQLPASGTALTAATSTRAAYSWVFDRSCYDQAMATAVWTGQDMWFQIESATSMLTTVFRAGPKMIRRRFWPRGPNLLPDRRDRSVADFGDPTSADWTTRLITYSGDTAQPIAMLAVGDGGHPVDPTVTDMEYTGGNHGLGVNDAEPTAYNGILQYIIDGSPASGDITGVANLIEIRSVNELTAGNTFSLGREVLSQSFTYYIRPGSFEIMADNEPLEDLLIGTDNGAQSFTQGFQTADGGQQIWIGKENAFVPFNAALDSGRKTTFVDPITGVVTLGSPNVTGVLFRSDAHGITGMWMDPAYGEPYGEGVDDDRPMCRGAGGNPNTKFYGAKYAGVGKARAKGQHYRYRAVMFDMWPGPAFNGYAAVIPISRAGVPDTLLLKSNGLLK